MSLKIGVIGCGHLGRWHTKMHTMLETSELIGVFDTDKEKCNKIAEEFKTTPYTNIEKLVNNCDALIIASTTSSHFEVAKMCLENNKHIFIEKPITSTVEEGEKLVAMAEEKNLIIQVGHIERYNPAFFATKDIKIDPKFIESHRLAQFNPRGTDVAVVLDLMIHDIDLILNLVKSPVTQIDASGVAVVTDTIDIANVRLGFENGAVANVTSSRISLKKMRKMRVFQKDTYLALDFDKGSADVFKLTEIDNNDFEGLSVGEIESTGKKIVYSSRPKVELNALLEENRDFVDAVQNNKEVKISGRDGLEALKVATEIIEKINKSLDRL